MYFITRVALIFCSCLISLNANAKVIIVAPAGGLAGLSSLILANRIDEKLHQRGHRFADLVDNGVGISIGAQIVTLLLEQNDLGAKRSTSAAVDLFLQSSPGTFGLFTGITRMFMNSYVEKVDIEKVVRKIFEEGIRTIDADSLAKLWDDDYHSYASFWTRVPELLLKVNPALNSALSAMGKEEQEQILRKKLHQEFGDATFNERAFDKVTAITSYDGRPVAMGAPALALPKVLRADAETSVVDGLIASAAMELLPDRYVNVLDHGLVVVTDGANAYSGMSPLETVVMWSLEESSEDDVIISLGNGGPYDSAYREGLDFRDGVAVVKKGLATTTIFALEPVVENWYMSTLVEERGLTEDLIVAANNVSDELIDRAASAMISAKNVGEKDALRFTQPHMTIHVPAFSTSIPPQELEQTCTAVVSTVGISVNLINETIRAVEETSRAQEELLRQARIDEEAQRIARELEEQARRAARELEEQRQRAEEVLRQERLRLEAAAREAEQQLRHASQNARRVFGRFGF